MPFALVGVNVMPRKSAALKKVMQKEKLNWRSFTGEDALLRQWNSPPTPTFYVIDHNGVIRHKWIGHPGEKTIDAALEKLIQEAQETNRS